MITEEWQKEPGAGVKLVERELYDGKKPVYDPTAMKGLPISVQIVGKKWEDEKLLAMMRVVDDALGSRGFGPGLWKGEKSE